MLIFSVSGSLYDFGDHAVPLSLCTDADSICIDSLEKVFNSGTCYKIFNMSSNGNYEPPYALKVYLDYQHHQAVTK